MPMGLGIGFDLGAVLLAQSGAGIQLSAATFLAGAAQGTAIGNLSTTGTTGTPTFTINPGDTHVQIAGAALQVGPTVSSAGSFSVTIRVTGVTPTIPDTAFLITATSSQSEPIPVIL